MGSDGAASRSLISALRTDADHWLPQVKGAPIVAVSGLMGEGIDRLMSAIEDAYAVWNKRVPTAALNRWFEQAVDANPPPAVSGRRLKLNYITQAKARPPSFVLFCSRADAVPQSYLRYLTNSHARGLRSAGHADADHAARKGQSVRPQAQAAVMSERGVRRALPTTPPVRSGAAAFIFVTILLDMLALGLILPILPKLVESFVDNDTASAARIFGLFGTAWALMQFFFSPILGALSDRFGRRPVVLLSNFGLALDYVLMALAPSLTWLFIGRVISGITSASISTAFAYIADVTPPERRAAVFGKIGAAFGAGFILGPALGGLLGGIGSAPAVLDRGGPELCQRALRLADPAGIAAAGAPLRRSAGKAPIRSARCICCARTGFWPGCRWRISSAQVAHVVLPSTFVLYATYRYGWDTTTVGLTLALVGVCADGGAGRGRRPDRQASRRTPRAAARACAAARSAFSFMAPRRPGRCSGSAFP